MLLLIGALLSVLLVSTNNQSASADPPSSWEVAGLSAQDFRVHGDGSITIADCNDYVQQTNSTISDAATTIATNGDVVTHVPKTASGGWITDSCQRTSTVGADSSYFVIQQKSYTYYRLVAYKNGAVRWAQSFKCNNGNDLQLRSVVMGNDANLYVTASNPSCSEFSHWEDRVLIGVNTQDGSERLRTKFTITYDWDNETIISLEHRLSVQTSKEVLFFDYNGDRLSSQDVVAGSTDSIESALSDDGDTLLYVVRQPNASAGPANCSAYREERVWYEKQGSGSPVNINLDACQAVVDRQLLPDGDIAYIYQDQPSGEWRLRRRSAGGMTVFDVSISTLSGYTVYPNSVYGTDAMTAGPDGIVYVKRRVKADSGSSSNDFDIRVDGFDGSGVSSLVYSTEQLNDPGVAENRGAMRAPSLGLAGDKLYMPFCSGNCAVGSTVRVVNVDVSVGFDYPRSTIFAEHPQLNYVALGDSFSSGEGVEPFDPYTAAPPTNECHRSDKAYSRLLVNAPGSKLRFNGFAFLACSGATIGNVNGDDSLQYSTQPLSQISMLTDDVDVATITVGGNNINFGATAATCATDANALNCMDAILDSEAKIDSQLEDDLAGLYEEISGSISEDGEVFVVGYPQIFPSENADDDCTWGTAPPTTQRPIEQAELDELRSTINSLNQRIENAVDAAGEHVHYVDPAPYFNGHEICSESPWFYNAISNTEDFVFSFHPNELGQEAYARAVLNEMNVVLG